MTTNQTTMHKYFHVEAVGTERGRAVLFLRGAKMEEITVPTDVRTMSELAALGVRVRNVA